MKIITMNETSYFSHYMPDTGEYRYYALSNKSLVEVHHYKVAGQESYFLIKKKISNYDVELKKIKTTHDLFGYSRKIKSIHEYEFIQYLYAASAFLKLILAD